MVGVIVWRKKRKPYTLSFIEPSTPRLDSYRESVKTKKRYFPHESGVIDLKRHPELLRFREVWGTKEYLVEPWRRDGDLYITEGETKAVIFEILETENGGIVAIPCLRTIETIIHEDNNDPLTGYKETFLGIAWDEGRKVVKSENVLGLVKYESI